jgi:hypothetical protein
MAEELSTKCVERRFLLHDKQLYAMKIRILDMVAGAIKNDGSHPQHSALHDAINRYVESAKRELTDLYEEGLKYSIMVDMSHHRRHPEDPFPILFRHEFAHKLDHTGI